MITRALARVDLASAGHADKLVPSATDDEAWTLIELAIAHEINSTEV